MARPRSRYNVYAEGKLFMQNVTIWDFCDKTGFQPQNVMASISRGNRVRGRYRFEKTGFDESRTEADRFKERWKAVIKEYYGHLDWKKIGTIPIIAEEKFK